jgi:DNA binding domain, excisionase family
MEATISEKSVLTFSEAANYAGFSKSTLYKLTSGRKIPHYKPSGKMVFFEREELDRWLLSNRVTPKEEVEEQAQAYCMKTKKGGAK